MTVVMIGSSFFNRQKQFLFGRRKEKVNSDLASSKQTANSWREQFKVELKFFSIVISSVTIRNSFFCTVKTHSCYT